MTLLLLSSSSTVNFIWLLVLPYELQLEDEQGSTIGNSEWA